MSENIPRRFDLVNFLGCSLEKTLSASFNSITQRGDFNHDFLKMVETHLPCKALQTKSVWPNCFLQYFATSLLTEMPHSESQISLFLILTWEKQLDPFDHNYLANF